MMQIAEILSDLTSLRVCGPEEAQALVNASKSAKESEKPGSSAKGKTKDKNLERAEDVVRLHHKFKIPYMNGVDSELQTARKTIEDLVDSLKERSGA